MTARILGSPERESLQYEGSIAYDWICLLAGQTAVHSRVALRTHELSQRYACRTSGGEEGLLLPGQSL